MFEMRSVREVILLHDIKVAETHRRMLLLRFQNNSIYFHYLWKKYARYLNFYLLQIKLRSIKKIDYAAKSIKCKLLDANKKRIKSSIACVD